MEDDPSADRDDLCCACCEEAKAITAVCMHTFSDNALSPNRAPVRGEVSWYASQRSIALRARERGAVQEKQNTESSK